MGERKGRSQKVQETISRQIDTVGSHVLKKVPKAEPKGSKLEPETEPKPSKIDALASQMQLSFIFLSQEDPGGGYRLKKHWKSMQHTIEYCKHNISKSYSECVYPTFACRYSGSVPTGACSKHARTLSKQLLNSVEVRIKPAHNL